MTAQPHHPTPAELAAFRATFPLAPYIVHPTPLPPYSDPRGRPVSGAWADECREGMPHGDVWHYAETWHATHARREAAALRSRAYAVWACVVCGGNTHPDGPGCACYGG